MPMSLAALESHRLTPWPREISLLRRTAVLAEAFAELFWLDLLGALGFRILRRGVARTRTAARPAQYDALLLVRVAVRDACIFYFKPVTCLQRSSAVTRMLRRRGIMAQLVIGYQPTPLEHHAWVELGGRVVWDHVAGLEFYRTVDRV